ncbi:hypothetical protein V1515DRAFT_588464 [Lipomyces mesembrius]
MLPIIYSWGAANTAGYTKRAMRNALTLMAFCIGNIIGPQMFKSNDAPKYDPAKIALIVTMSLVVVFAVGLRQLVLRENAKIVSENIENIEFLDMTDIDNREFRHSQ